MAGDGSSGDVTFELRPAMERRKRCFSWSVSRYRDHKGGSKLKLKNQGSYARDTVSTEENTVKCSLSGQLSRVIKSLVGQKEFRFHPKSQ